MQNINRKELQYIEATAPQLCIDVVIRMLIKLAKKVIMFRKPCHSSTIKVAKL